MSEIDRVKEEIACATCGWRDACKEKIPGTDLKPSGDTCSIQLQDADRVLKIKSLAIVDRKAKLPENPFPFMTVNLGTPLIDRKQRTRYCDYKVAQNAMLKEGWVKEIIE